MPITLPVEQAALAYQSRVGALCMVLLIPRMKAFSGIVNSQCISCFGCHDKEVCRCRKKAYAAALAFHQQCDMTTTTPLPSPCFCPRRHHHPCPPTLAHLQDESTACNIAHCVIVLSFFSWHPHPRRLTLSITPLILTVSLGLTRHFALARCFAVVLSISPSPSPPSHDDDDMITAPSRLSRRHRHRLGRLSPPSPIPSLPCLAMPDD